MTNAWKAVDDALSDADLASIRPRGRKRLKMYALAVLLARDGMRRNRLGSASWRGFRRIFAQSAGALEGMLGREGAARVVDRIVSASREGRIRLPR